MSRLKVTIGEKVDVSTGAGQVYRTLLEDITSDGHLVISAPIFRGIPVILHKDQEIVLYFYRDNGRFGLDARVEGFTLDQNLRLISLLPTSAPRKQQRRESYRLQATLEAMIRPFTGGSIITDDFLKDDETKWEKVLTNNISETGFSVNTLTDYARNDQIYIKLFLCKVGEKVPPVELIGAIRQRETVDFATEKYRIGVEFITLTDDVRRQIARFLLLRQQEYIRAEANRDGE